MTTRAKPTYPLFEMYNLGELEEKLAYSAYYLIGIRGGSQPCTRRFRKTAALILKHTEAELFGESSQ